MCATLLAINVIAPPVKKTRKKRKPAEITVYALIILSLRYCYETADEKWVSIVYISNLLAACGVNRSERDVEISGARNYCLKSVQNNCFKKLARTGSMAKIVRECFTSV